MDRIALYIGDTGGHGGEDLGRYFADARACGLRIVTVKREASAKLPGERPVLKRLVKRMEAGEFGAIVVVVDADVAASSLPPPTIHGDCWVPRAERAR